MWNTPDFAADDAEVIASVHPVSMTFTFPGSKHGAVTVIEGETPCFAFNIRETRRGNLAEATDITHKMSRACSFSEPIRISVVRPGRVDSDKPRKIQQFNRPAAALR